MSRLAIDPADPTPPYEQIRRGIRRQISTGLLDTGDRLPAIRALAEELGLAAGTVARAYKELEEEGWVTTRRGAGTRVSAEGMRAVRAADGQVDGERSGAEPPGAPGGSTGRGASRTDPELRRLFSDAVAAARGLGHRDEEIAAAAREALRWDP